MLKFKVRSEEIANEIDRLIRNPDMARQIEAIAGAMWEMLPDRGPWSKASPNEVLTFGHMAGLAYVALTKAGYRVERTQ